MKAIKYSLPILLFAIFTFASGCQKETFLKAKTRSASGIKGTWNLVHVYGGIAGIDEQHAHGEVTWTFGTTDLVVADNTSGSAYFSLPSGTYPYTIIQSGSLTYLSIQNAELGQFVISGNDMNIDQNKQSTGEGACGFYMELER